VLLSAVVLIELLSTERFSGVAVSISPTHAFGIFAYRLRAIYACKHTIA